MAWYGCGEGWGVPVCLGWLVCPSVSMGVAVATLSVCEGGQYVPVCLWGWLVCPHVSVEMAGVSLCVHGGGWYIPVCP